VDFDPEHHAERRLFFVGGHALVEGAYHQYFSGNRARRRPGRGILGCLACVTCVGAYGKGLDAVRGSGRGHARVIDDHGALFVNRYHDGRAVLPVDGDGPAEFDVAIGRGRAPVIEGERKSDRRYEIILEYLDGAGFRFAVAVSVRIVEQRRRRFIDVLFEFREGFFVERQRNLVGCALGVEP